MSQVTFDLSQRNGDSYIYKVIYIMFNISQKEINTLYIGFYISYFRRIKRLIYNVLYVCPCTKQDIRI